MPDLDELHELVSYLTRTSRLTFAEATRVVNEIVSFMDETPEDFIRRRHRALQNEGLPNAEIYSRLAAELQQWRFRASVLSERQIRRIIYG